MVEIKPVLTIKDLIRSAERFCEVEDEKNHSNLLGVTDGKAIGTYIEHSFQDFLSSHYEVEIGNSSRGIDLPGKDIQTDIKVTSVNQPQSSSPFESTYQKVYGLGCNLLIFIYEKIDKADLCRLYFTHCIFIDKKRTADFTTTKLLCEMVSDGAKQRGCNRLSSR